MDNDFSGEDFADTLEALEEALDGLQYADVMNVLGYFIAQLAHDYSGGFEERDEVLDNLEAEISSAVEYLDEVRGFESNGEDAVEAEPLSDNDPVSDVIYSILDGLEDEEKLEYLAIAAAEVLQEYEPGEDRDVMVEFLGQNIDAAVEVLDEAEAELEEVDAAFDELKAEAVNPLILTSERVAKTLQFGHHPSYVLNDIVVGLNETTESGGHSCSFTYLSVEQASELRDYLDGYLDERITDDTSYEDEPACTCCQ